MLKLDFSGSIREVDGNIAYEMDRMGNFILDSSGNKIEISLRSRLSNMLASGQDEDFLKFADFSREVSKTGFILCDESDRLKIESVIKSSKTITNLVKADLWKCVANPITEEVNG